jgi:hypothetical protein
VRLVLQEQQVQLALQEQVVLVVQVVLVDQ